MKSIELENVSFNYPNGFLAVENVSLIVEKGEKVAIIGQNGAGKTTAVKLMNGLLRPSSGVVKVNEEDISKMSTATVSRKVGYVFQNPGDQLFNKTVFDEIAYTLRHDRVDTETINQKVKEVAELCHVTEFLDDNPYDLPFSLRKFVTIAIVVANDCETIILDEPTAGQDLFGVLWLKEIINKLHDQGKTIITITHDMDFVIDNFERVIVMAHKNIIGDAQTNEIFWDLETLEEADIRQPVIAQLASELGITERVVSIDEVVELIKQ